MPGSWQAVVEFWAVVGNVGFVRSEGNTGVAPRLITQGSGADPETQLIWPFRKGL